MSTHTFRFSPRVNKAADILWRPWGREAFDEAAAADKPILLCLTAVWCHWCQQMDETTYSEPDLIALINETFIPVRVDADQYPHVHDRYIAAGWPTNAFLTPTGEVLWSGTYIPAEQFEAVAQSVRTAWLERRAELAAEIDRRRKALEAARGRPSSAGLVRREAADDVLSAIQESFDLRNGGFGEEPKYPTPDAIELLLLRAHTSPDDLRLATMTLDGMIAGELWDAVEGGFYRYALRADWTQPQTEKLLGLNARLLRVYAQGAQVAERADFARIAERTYAWGKMLKQPSGLWGGSQSADPEYYAESADGRRSRTAPLIDPVIYTSSNAQWIRALADAGARLEHPGWIEEAANAFDLLFAEMRASTGLMYHYREPDAQPQLATLLADSADTAAAAVTLAEVTGRTAYADIARDLVATIEDQLWADESGFYDRTRTPHDVGVLRYRDRPFDLNADMARLLLDMLHATGDRSCRAMAERTLAVLSPLAGRYGVGAAGFAIAVHEFFDPSPRVFVVGSGVAAAELRRAALRVPHTGMRVWTLPEGGRIGTRNFVPSEQPTAWVVTPRKVSHAITQPSALADAIKHTT